MERGKAKTYFEVASSFVVLLVALVVLGNFAWKAISDKKPPTLERGLHRGDRFSSIPGLDYADASRTMILAMSLKCEYCSDSMPFYRRLLKERGSNPRAMRIVAVFPEASPEVTDYLREHEIDLTMVPMIDHKALGFPGPPSAVLVDEHGKIVDFWIGRMSQEVERRVLEITR